MMTAARIFAALLGLLMLLLTGCGSEPVTPPLVEPGQPTLVYVFTDG